MYSTVFSGGICGIRSYLAKVEVDIARSIPGFEMVGKLAKEVLEARERVKVAIKNSDIELPSLHITVNISPADMRKTGTTYDLPIAIGILVAAGNIPQEYLKDVFIIGELGLNGEVCPVDGVLPMIMEAKRKKRKRCIVPYDNSKEAANVQGVTIIGVKDLKDAVEYLMNSTTYTPVPNNDIERALEGSEYDEDFSDVYGQEVCKRAALIAAAGFHHMLLCGPPGSGKTMIARRMITILPRLNAAESLEVSAVYSVAGMLDDNNPLIVNRPFMSPHHATTKQALTGGGVELRPGILTLSHKGVLFLDELPEFTRECIETLREPLEEKRVQIARVHGIYSYPADFMLVAAANPCPCGYYPDRSRCNCTENEIRRYRGRISGPIKERIDIIVTADKIDIKNLDRKSNDETSAMMYEKVKRARRIQAERFEGTKTEFNSRIKAKDISKYCELGDAERDYIEKAYEAMNLSARSYHKILKVARTIADLEESENIKKEHLAEALCYRG